MYVPERYKTKEIYDKVVLENSWMLGFISDFYKELKKMCDQTVDNYAHALKFVLDCYKS